jgi:undecaprenyl-diphosphatase
MNFFQLMILAVVQGITEFLPISSDGHLVIVGEYFKQSGARMDLPAVVVALHAGTLLSIIVFYWRRLWSLLWEDRRVIPLLIVGTIPAVIFGLTMKYTSLKQQLENPVLAGAMLLVTGGCLLWAQRQPVGTEDYRQMPWWRALYIGIAQATAILPGLSRSGTTISSALALGLTRESAATFSFVLGVPAIAGAVLLEIKDMVKAYRTTGDFTLGVDPTHLAIAIVVSFVVGLFSIWCLVRVLERGKLSWFGYYCLILGVGVLIWQGMKSA